MDNGVDMFVLHILGGVQGSRGYKQLVCSWPCSSQHMMGWSSLAQCLCSSYSRLKVKQSLRQFPWGCWTWGHQHCVAIHPEICSLPRCLRLSVHLPRGSETACFKNVSGWFHDIKRELHVLLHIAFAMKRSLQ